MINDYEATKPMTADAIPSYPDTTSNDDVISTLNGLIQTCKDGEEVLETPPRASRIRI